MVVTMFREAPEIQGWYVGCEASVCHMFYLWLSRESQGVVISSPTFPFEKEKSPPFCRRAAAFFL